MKLIAAVDNNWGLGRNNRLLFHIPEDLRRFRSLTENNTVVMGRKTLASLPEGKPLVNRENIVLTRNPAFFAEGAHIATSVTQLKAMLLKEPFKTRETYLIGGAEIFAELLPYCSIALLTHILADGRADRFLPLIIAHEDWKLEARSESHFYNGLEFYYATYRNLKIASLID